MTQLLYNSGVVFAVLFALFAVIAAPFIMKPDTSGLRTEYQEMYDQAETSFANERKQLRERYDSQIAQIEINQLKNSAKAHYSTLWEERRNYNSKYALSAREKAQLRMLTLANERTKSANDIIREIATEAAPKDSEINVYATKPGLRLDIDFLMSALTRGEEGTTTKHHTLDSLKDEVIVLISRVTNDAYEFCQDLDLETIHIGCKHVVRMTYPNGTSRDEDIILYKISLKKTDIKEMKHDPFLDIYSTRKYFNVEIDEFSNLTIETIQL